MIYTFYNLQHFFRTAQICSFSMRRTPQIVYNPANQDSKIKKQQPWKIRNSNMLDGNKKEITKSIKQTLYTFFVN